MIKQLKKRKKLYITPLGLLMAFIIMYTIMPIWSQLISDYLSTYLYMTLLMIVLVGLMLSDNFHTLIQYVVLLLPLVLYYFLVLVSNQWNEIILWGYGTLVECLPLLFGFYLCHIKKRLARFEGLITLSAVAITTLTTIVGTIRYPSAARTLATEAVENTPWLRIYNLNNIGGYDFVYLLVLLYPLLIYAYKHKKIKLFPTLILSAAILFCVLQSEYALALLFFAISTVLFFVNRKFTPKKLLLLTIVSAILILIFWTQVSKLIVWAAGYIDSADVKERLLAIAGGRKGLTELDDKRILLYMRSLENFAQHPLLGLLSPGANASIGSGGHSFIMDSLSEFGLVGALIISVIYKKTYDIFYRPFKKDNDYGFIFWCFLQPIVMSVFNPGMWTFYLMFAAPVLIRLIRGEDPEPVKEKEPASPDDANAEPEPDAKTDANPSAEPDTSETTDAPAKTDDPEPAPVEESLQQTEQPS